MAQNITIGNNSIQSNNTTPVYIGASNYTVSSYVTTGTTTITGTITPGTVNTWIDYGPVSSTKKITIEGMTIRIIKYSNYKIAINDVNSRFINDETGTHVKFNVGQLVYFDTVAEAKAFLNKIRGQIKKMKAFAKECDIDSDFV